MHHKYALFVRFVNIIYDLFSINISIVIIYLYVTKALPLVHGALAVNYIYLCIIANLTWFASAYLCKVYTLRNLIYFKEGVKNSSKGFIVFFCLLIIINFLGNYEGILTQKIILSLVICYSLLYWSARAIFYFLKKAYSLELYVLKKILIVGNAEYQEVIKQTLFNNKECGFVYEAFIDDNIPIVNLDIFFEDIYSKIAEKKIEDVFIVKSNLKNEHIYQLVQNLDKRAIRVKIIPDLFDFHKKPQNLTFIGALPVLSLRDEPLQSLFNRMVKRFFDIIFSLFVILFILTWLLPILFILIKLESKGPIFFKQLRSGRNNKEFWCYKFRSMRLNSNADKIQASKNDKRVTKVGSFIRKTSIDELPQFFNVLFGDMSVVGPRPHMLKHTKEYASIVDKYMIRHFVKPGITGWAQVKGYRGEIIKPSDIQKRIEYDIWYIENWSILLDIQTILLTIYNIFIGEKKAY